MVKEYGYLGLPALEGYKLSKVVAVLNDREKNAEDGKDWNIATGCKVSIKDAKDGNVVTGGAEQTWNTKGASYTYTLSNTEANKMYYLCVSTENCQIKTLTLSYEKIESVTLTGTPGDVHYATYYGTKAMEVDENTTIATCYVENNTIYVNDLEGKVIPANGAVLLHSTNTTITLTETTKSADAEDVEYINDEDSNMLFGYAEDTHVDAVANTYYYALNTSGGKAGFFVPRTTDDTANPSAANGFTAKAGKAYLKVVSASGAKEGFEFNDTPTGVNAVKINSENSELYNVQGVRVNDNFKGIVISNGKKYLLK